MYNQKKNFASPNQTTIKNNEITKPKKILIRTSIALFACLIAASTAYGYTAHKDISTVQKSLSSKEEEISNYEKKIRDLNTSLKITEKEKSSCKEKLDKINKQTSTESNKIEELQKQIEDLKKENETIKAERDAAIATKKEAEETASLNAALNPTVETKHENINGYDWNYFLYQARPKAKKQKLIVFLHGSGEVGSDLSILENCWSLPHLINSEGYEPDCNILMPQSPEQGWNIEALKNLIDHVIEITKSDTAHISITGVSMGGFGTWDMIGTYPTFFEAAAPIASTPYNLDQLKNCTCRVMALSGTADGYDGTAGVDTIKNNQHTAATHLWVEGATHSDMCNIYQDEKYNPIPFLLGEASTS